jgi:hypothetical protein
MRTHAGETRTGKNRLPDMIYCADTAAFFGFRRREPLENLFRRPKGGKIFDKKG